jgi:hypothetical protein
MATTKTILPKSKPDVIADLKGMETGRVTEAGKPVYKYKGEEISERAIDIEADGKVYVIPTVIKGKLYNPDAAARMFYDKKVEPINIIEKGKKTQEDITTMIKNRSVKLFEGGDTSIDTSKLKSGVKEKKDARKIQFDSMTKMLTSGKVKDLSIEEKDKFVKLYKMLKQHHSFNEGGVAKQMELFEDGGLKDEGGMIDEVSGNDVPTGSTREEVRDDIPAQLSEGEFVFPADVVRYHGLDKLMQLRDEAKMGLRKMEDMGQMGNSEEATLPDDMPFSMEDLDMEDDEPMQEDNSMEMAEGGYVMIAGKPMPIPRIGGQLPPITTRPNEPTKNMAVGGFTNPTGTYQVPTNIATQPSYFQNYAQSTAPFSPFNPVETPIGTPLPTSTPVVGQTGQGPSFNTLMPQLTGKRETKEYRNAAGQKLFIPFINDEPIYPIPEGYTLFTAEAVTEKPIQTTSQSTSVRQDEGGSDNPLSGTTSVRGLDGKITSTNFSGMNPTDVAKSMGNMSTSDRGKSVMDALQQSYGYTGFAKGMQQLGALAVPGVMASKMYGQKTMNPMDVLGQIGQPNQDARNSISAAFGAVNSAGTALGYADLSGYVDDPMSEITNEQNALNTAVFGGSITGTGPQTVAGINQVTDKDIASMYGIAPERDARGNYTIGTNPGQISSTGSYYSASGVGNDPGKAEYSSFSAMTNYTTTAGKFGYYGTLGMAIEQAKQGNKKAQAVVNAMKVKDKYGIGVDVDAISDRSFGDNIGPGDGGAPTGDPDDDDSANTNTGYTAPSLSTVTSMPSNMTPNNDDEDNNNDNDGGTSSGAGDAGGSVGDGYGGGDYKGAFVGTQYKINKGLAGKKKKPKLKKMKRGGLASR